MKWLLSIFDLESAGTGIVLSLPPIASDDPILAWIWSYIATIQMGQLPADRVKAAFKLASLAQDNDRNKKLIVDEGGVFPLLKLLKEASSTEEQIAATHALFDLAGDTDTIRAILNEGGVPIIAQILRDSAMEVQTRAASLMAKMVQHDSFAGFEFAKENVTRPLVTLLSFDSFVEESMIQLEPVASASAPAPFQWEYDVFLNFVGMDCPNLIPLLQGELQESKHSKILMCDVSFGELRDIASPSASLPRKIKASRLAIIVLSRHYTSAFCMELLIMILHCVEDKSRILPIYYDMDPSDVPYQWENHSETVLTRWRNALCTVAADGGFQAKSVGELATHIVKILHSETTGSVDTTNEPENESEDESEASMSLSSDEPAPLQKYDVFLSFRGEDTRKGFLSHLYHELQNTGLVKTFKDDEQLKKGTAISSNLLTAIEESRFAILVLSQNYAYSTWCLNELAKIYECMKEKDSILPIFYHVDPSDVRHQKKNFGDAFTMHNTSEDKNKVKLWRAALKGVAGIAGWDIKNYNTERELVEDIVKYVWSKVLKEPTGDFEAYGATKQAMDEVMKALKDDQVTIIGVHGMRGAGKTTMVKHVGAQAQNNGLFDYVVMVAVSQKPDFQKIQVSLANFLGLKLEEETNIGRASRLKERILRENKILIILDDIGEGIALESIGLPDYEELRRCKSKVIFTTRMSNVCDSMQCHAQIHLDVLSEEDSWKFLMEKSGKSFLKSTDSGNEARKLARRCDGLPNALKATVRALGDKYLEEWNEAVARAFGDSYLEKWNEESQLVNFRADRDVFHSLASEAKSCLLLCCLFPEDYDIPIEDILKYGIGNGLFQYDTMEEARDRENSVVKYLKASRLLLEGTKKGCIRMHNEIRDVAMSVALLEEGHEILVKADCELKDWPMNAHKGYSAISLMRNKLRKLPENLVCPELQILLLQCNVGIREIPDTFFRNPSTLRVFDLSFTSIAILPSSFSFLSNLQTLNLDYCSKLIDISILGRLSKLEILSMRKCPLKKFPEEIGDLTNLRMLDVTGGCVETVPSNVLSRLYRLEELHMKVEFGDWGSKIKEAVEETNAEFDELTGLSYLNILKVYISDTACLPKNVEEFKPNWVEYDICISKDVPWDMVLNDHPSRTLTLDTTVKSLPDWFINVVTEKAENLEYINCKDLSNILVEYNHGRLHRLKHLSVNGRHKNLKELMNVLTWDLDKPVFESLEKLHLLYLQSLKQLCVGDLPPGSLRNLKLLKVQTCRSLENALLPSKLLRRLRNLEKIVCVNMEVMKYVFSFERLDSEKSLLSNLKEMRLCSLSELVSIYNGPAPHAFFHNLKVLAVCECKELKYLFTSDIAECLFQLEDLCLEHCGNLENVIDASRSLNKIVLPALKNLALRNLPELKSFCTIGSGTIEMECPSLENLYVEKCPQFPHAAHHFGSKNQVHFNDQQHLSSLVKRWEEMHISDMR